ncbi:SDR family oxidoreductase [Candidatus Gottesmanbacteria bacterium]|nr:SDR family oxidoreductase [Candidatus Gottesmanbacteria bacterium]
MKRTVLITGGSRGIGAAIATLLKKEGYAVIAPTRAELDLKSDNSIESFIQHHKAARIDILVNNAGVNNPQRIDEVSDENITETMQINLIAPVKLIRAVVPGMKKRKWGRIVNISSMFGIIARGRQVLYAATKHGINGVTKALCLELAPHNILVNSVCPGFTATDLVLRNPPEKVKALVAEVPVGRLAKPVEIARLVHFLISEKNTYITGETVLIDGGYTCR